MGILVVTYMLMYSITLDIVEVIYRDSFTYQSVSHFLGAYWAPEACWV